MMVIIDPIESAFAGVITAFFNQCRLWFADRRRIKILKRMLKDKRFKFRSFDQLQKAAGVDAERTKSLLLKIGARPSEGEKDVWTLN